MMSAFAQPTDPVDGSSNQPTRNKQHFYTGILFNDVDRRRIPFAVAICTRTPPAEGDIELASSAWFRLPLNSSDREIATSQRSWNNSHLTAIFGKRDRERFFSFL